jgi:hypothetical protein
MRTCLGVLFAFALFALAAPGCGPGVAEEELGTVIFDTREIPGGDEPYVLPDVSQPSSPESETEPADEL